MSGQRIDYLSPTTYLTDIFIFLLFILSLRQKKLQISKKSVLVLLGGLLFLSLGIFLSQSPIAGWYGLLKLVEFTFFGWLVVQNAGEVKALLPIAVGIDLVLESLLVLAQFILHRSFGGVSYFLGERTFTASTPGIANASLAGQLVLRPYGTFSHPNVLAGFLLLGVLLLFLLLLHNFKKNVIYLPIAILGFVGLLLTLSRVTIVLGILSFFVLFLLQWKKNNNKRVLVFVLSMLIIGGNFVTFIFPTLFNRFFFGDITGETFVYRKTLAEIALQMFWAHPFFGVGLNNFLPVLPSFSLSHQLIGFIQPVHNIYFLVLSQTGIIGLFFFIYFLIRTFQNLIATKTRDVWWQWSLISLIVILIIGFFDHYFLTLQQGQLLFALVLGMCWSQNK